MLAHPRSHPPWGILSCPLRVGKDGPTPRRVPRARAVGLFPHCNITDVSTYRIGHIHKGQVPLRSGCRSGLALSMYTKLIRVAIPLEIVPLEVRHDEQMPDLICDTAGETPASAPELTPRRAPNRAEAPAATVRRDSGRREGGRAIAGWRHLSADHFHISDRGGMHDGNQSGHRRVALAPVPVRGSLA